MSGEMNTASQTEMGKDNKRLVKTTQSLVGVTFLLFIVGMGGVLSTRHYMGKQVAEMKRSTQLQWRPFLNLEIDTTRFVPHYDLEGSGTDTGSFREMYKIKINSDAYKAVKQIVWAHNISFRCWNPGATPLRIIKIRTKGIPRKTWESEYGKSSINLIKDIRHASPLDSVEYDLLIFPDSSLHFPVKLSGLINMLLADFEYYRDSLNEIVFYPYVYIEYEDFFGNRYNTIFILYQIQDLLVVDGYLMPPPRERFGTEQYRWDIGLESD